MVYPVNLVAEWHAKERADALEVSEARETGLADALQVAVATCDALHIAYSNTLDLLDIERAKVAKLETILASLGCEAL